MKIEQLNIDLVRPYWRNPRKNEDAIDAVSQSIELYGFNVPILVDKKNVIIAGHTRYKAAKKLGLSEVPCITLEISQEKAKEFRIADNKTSELSQWDWGGLVDELKEIDDIGNMAEFFPDLDLEKIIEGMTGAADDPNFEAVTAEIIKDAETKEGETFRERSRETLSERIELMCPECGEAFFVSRHDILTRPG
jgi:hypothetical protein